MPTPCCAAPSESLKPKLIPRTGNPEPHGRLWIPLPANDEAGCLVIMPRLLSRCRGTSAPFHHPPSATYPSFRGTALPGIFWRAPAVRVRPCGFDLGWLDQRVALAAVEISAVHGRRAPACEPAAAGAPCEALMITGCPSPDWRPSPKVGSSAPARQPRVRRLHVETSADPASRARPRRGPQDASRRYQRRMLIRVIIVRTVEHDRAPSKIFSRPTRQ